MKKIICLLVIVFPIFLFGMYEADYLNIPTNAIIAGTAGVSTYNNPFDKNPANGIFYYDNLIAFSHAFLFTDKSSLNEVSFFTPINHFFTGIALSYYEVDNIPIYAEEWDSLQPSEPDSFFNAYSTIYKFNLGYGKKIYSVSFGIGLRVNYFYQELLLRKGSGASYDIGVSCSVPINMDILDRSMISLYFKNVLGKGNVFWTGDTLDDREEELSSIYGMDVGMNISIKKISTDFSIRINYEYVPSGYDFYGISIIGDYYDIINLFTGFSSDGWGSGIGLKSWNMSIKYAYLLVDAGSTHRLTGEISW